MIHLSERQPPNYLMRKNCSAGGVSGNYCGGGNLNMELGAWRISNFPPGAIEGVAGAIISLLNDINYARVIFVAYFRFENSTLWF